MIGTSKKGCPLTKGRTTECHDHKLGQWRTRETQNTSQKVFEICAKVSCSGEMLTLELCRGLGGCWAKVAKTHNFWTMFSWKRKLSIWFYQRYSNGRVSLCVWINLDFEWVTYSQIEQASTPTPSLSSFAWVLFFCGHVAMWHVITVSCHLCSEIEASSNLLWRRHSKFHGYVIVQLIASQPGCLLYELINQQLTFAPNFWHPRLRSKLLLCQKVWTLPVENVLRCRRICSHCDLYILVNNGAKLQCITSRKSLLGVSRHARTLVK